MAQDYYYSSLTGAQIDEALSQISQAQSHAAAAAASALAAQNSADAAAASAAEADGYSKLASDLRFSPAILLEQSGAAIAVTGQADAPAVQLRIFGRTTLSGTPGPDAPAVMASAGDGGEIGLTLGSTTLALPTQQGLPGISVQHKDSAYAVTCTDSGGQKWIADEIDPVRGVRVQRLFRITLDGSEEWKSSVAGKFALGSLYYEPLLDFEPDKKYNEAFHLCSHFKAVGYYAQTDGGVCAFNGSNGRTLMFWHSACADVAGWKAYLAEQYAAGTPVTVLLRRSVPQEAALAADIPEACAALRLGGITDITNDASAHMALTYIADTKTYIDQKLAAVSAALLG